MRKHKNEKWGRRLGASALFTVLLCISLCIPLKAAPQDGQRTVRVPYGYNDFLEVDETGTVSGYYADYLTKLGNINNWSYEYVPCTWPEAVELLESGGVDILYPTNYSKQREEKMDYSALPTGYISTGIFALETKRFHYEDYASFDGARIAYVKGSSNEPMLEEYAAAHNFSYVPVYKNTNYEIVFALENGDAELAVFNAADAFPGGVLLAVMDAKPVFFTVKKGNTELLNEIDSGMQTLARLDAGLAGDTFFKTLIGNNSSILAFTREEQGLLDSGREITVGFYTDCDPLAYQDKNEEYQGIYIEFLSYINKKFGLNLVPYAIDRDKNWKELIASGEIDFYMGASSVMVADDANICLTDAFIEYTNLLVTRNDCAFNRIGSPVIALTYGRANWADFLRRRLNKDIQIKYYNTAKECMFAVVNGEADASLINNYEFNYQIKNNRLTRLIRWPQYRFPTEVCFAASADVDPVMLATVSKTLRMLKPEYTDMVIEEYLNIPYHSYSLSDRIYYSRNIIAAMFGTVLVGALIAVFVYVLQRRQRRQQVAADERERRKLNMMAALSGDYVAIYSTDLDKDENVIIRLKSERGRTEIFGSESTHTEAFRKYVEDVVLPEYQEQLRPYCDTKEIIRHFETEKDFYIRYQTKPDEQERQYFEMHFVDVSEKEQEHRMIFGVRCIEDVVKEELEQQRALQDALDGANQANAAKSEFLSKMSHDIRTPLNAIIGMTFIAEQHVEDPLRVRDALKKITGASNHLLELINDVLDMSKIEAGKISLTEEDFSLHDLLINFLTIIQPQIDAHHHSITFDIEETLQNEVRGDSLRLQQILLNLMGNAIKYTPDNGEIYFMVRQKSVKTNSVGCYEFMVKDNGIGMTKEVLANIFDPFNRAEDLRISKIQGTGLGLSIAQNIAHMMGGNITVESEYLKGSTFTLTVFLTLRETEKKTDGHAADKEKTESLSGQDFSGNRVLLVEDNELNREIAREIFEMMGLAVEDAENGQIALEMFEKAEQGYYRMIFMDVQMPVMNGYESTRAIRGLDRPDAKAIPIIAMTANAFLEDKENSRAAGMNEHLSKPIVIGEITKVLQKYLH